MVSKGGNDFVYLPGTVLSKKRAIMTPGNIGFPTIISSTLFADSLPEEVGLDKTVIFHQGSKKFDYTILANLSTKYLMMCNVYTNVSGIK